LFFDKAEKYTQGLFLSRLRNIERICESVHSSDYFQMQHFISDAKWDARQVMDHVAVRTSITLPKRKLTGLIIDETGTVKKGDKSVGVGWQYCGNVGKISNSQVAVMACLSNGDFASMVDARLFLPKDWCNNAERCEEAGIPEHERHYRTKLELAREIILNQIKLGSDFDFVSADGFYGNDPEFASSIEDMGYLYMLDVHADQPIYFEQPEIKVPARKSNKGRTPTIAKPDKKSIRVDKYAESLDAEKWIKIKVRNTCKGTLTAYYHFAKVFIWNKTRNTIERRLLVIRRTKTKKGFENKYSFTNANFEQYTKQAIAYMQAQRFFVEHCIKESKQVLGMSQFQTRKWKAWYHQIAINLMVACFLLKEKLRCFEDLPLLSAWDIKDWICYNLYTQLNRDEMIELIFLRHYKRQKDINQAFMKNSF